MKQIKDFCDCWQISEFAFFGSILRDDFGQNSNVDILIQFHPDSHPTLFDLVQMEDELQIVFNRDVDLVTRKGIAASRNYLRRQAILNSAQTIYEPGSFHSKIWSMNLRLSR